MKSAIMAGADQDEHGSASRSGYWHRRLGLDRFRHQYSAVAIDAGGSALRALQLRRTGTASCVQDWVKAESSGASADEPDSYATTIERLHRIWDRRQFRGRRVVSFLQPPEVEFWPLKVPAGVWASVGGSASCAGRSTQIGEALRWEIGRRLSFAADEAEVRAWPVPEGASGETNALAVAARKSAISERVQALAARGFGCSRIDVSACALIRACRQHVVEPSDGKGEEPAGNGGNEIWGVLDMGLRGHRLYLAVGDVPAYVRAVHSSGAELTESIAKALDVPVTVAEQFKRECGIRPVVRGLRSSAAAPRDDSEPSDRRPAARAIPSAELPSVLYSIVRPALSAMLKDVERSFSYLLECHRGKKPAKLVLAGGGANLNGLPEYIAEQMGIEVVRASKRQILPVSVDGPDLGEDFAGMVVCAGLALVDFD